PSASGGSASAPPLEGAAAAPGTALSEYVNAKQQYRLLVPADWDVKGKAGADVLFEDPARRSTSVGITVNPVKVASIAQFGGLGDVGAKLLEAERKKVPPRLYILNAAFKCDKDGCGPASAEGVQLLRRVAGTFDVTAA
ncbi:PsbP domain-containing protein 2, chloroplastic, partial [Tetrabaena socialis]